MLAIAQKQSAEDHLAVALQASLNEFDPSPSPRHPQKDAEVLEQVSVYYTYTPY